MSPIIRSQATSFGATMKGRTGGLESEGSPEGFGLPSLTGSSSTTEYPFGGDTDGEPR
jgi:hypothetical protein